MQILTGSAGKSTGRRTGAMAVSPEPVKGLLNSPGIFHETLRVALEDSWNGHAKKSSASSWRKSSGRGELHALSRVRTLRSLRLYANAEINSSSAFFPEKL